VCGILAAVAWIVPIAGAVLAAIGFLLLRLGAKTRRGKLAKAASFLNAVGLVASIWNGAIGALHRLLR